MPRWTTDEDGLRRFWDGRSWGPAPPRATASLDVPDSDRYLAAFAHAGVLVCYLIPSLVVLAASRKRTDAGGHFVQRHARAALNGQLTFIIGWNVSGGAAFALSELVSEHFRWGFVISVAVFAWMIANSVLGARAAVERRPWDYPYSIRFLKTP